MLINLCPHALTFPNDIKLESSGQARCEWIDTVAYERGIKIIQRSYGEVTGLPEPEPGTIYIVSLAIRLACPERKDLASPHFVIKDKETNEIKLVKAIIM